MSQLSLDVKGVPEQVERGFVDHLGDGRMRVDAERDFLGRHFQKPAHAWLLA